MVQLVDAEIRTREVLDWKGIHVFHIGMSSCSQKLRMVLGLKGLPWTSHLIDPLTGENLTEYYLGVNPRGLIPALVIDGEVHVESNDIILMLEHRFPTPPLVPPSHRHDIATLLHHEDELHIDLRTISFRFLVRPLAPPKAQAELDAYQRHGSGTIGGQADAAKDREIAFWQQFHQGGIKDQAACAAVARFRSAFAALDEQLNDQPFLLGHELSVLDVAWVVYLHRLLLCSYPAARLHPRLMDWYERLSRLPAIRQELAMGGQLAATNGANDGAGTSPFGSVAQVCGL